jgi:hypothetical protein
MRKLFIILLLGVAGLVHGQLSFPFGIQIGSQNVIIDSIYQSGDSIVFKVNDTTSVYFPVDTVLTYNPVDLIYQFTDIADYTNYAIAFHSDAWIRRKSNTKYHG